MPAQITMAFYTGIVLECQHCYRICRWSDAAVRRNCPSCGLDIGNWQALTDEVNSRLAPASETSRE
ncbi:hypothetical protein [Candidatus Entotheonella palauensis]|uniref:Uncharacterized protein n=1 Tax=Candidatus Entotheonella gemina TaxID=1429439 RepID=W4M448_9BACT|nr:hypothetical protein [Candidatus Entotheonella palauensis]ETX04397.1 MAG: hypothetical protein ETSY2_29030 [Candidatus Entotheonella gemina]